MSVATMTPALCDAAAERLIGAYLQETGAYGDLERCRHALEMLISKAAIGYGMASNQVAMMDLMLRTAYHVAHALDGGAAGVKGTVQ